MGSILIIDDDEYVRDVLADNCQRLHHKVAIAGTLTEGMALTLSLLPDLVFLDVRLPDGNGLNALPKIRQVLSFPEVIIITGAGDDEGAELATKSGAWDYIQKPLSKHDIILHVRRTFQYREKKKKPYSVVLLKTEGIVGNSPQLRGCLETAAACAQSAANVLITGDTGTGKELFARAIHTNSERRDKPFVVVDCAALPENLAESILFGHEKGAFTGAERKRDGLIKEADGGTLFLDEVGELPAATQKTFLRVLQERCFLPVGSNKEMESDFRLIAATHRNLEDMVESGNFRKDLLFRLRTIVIDLPPLRNRSGDIQDLTIHYIKCFSSRYDSGMKGFSPEFFGALFDYPWPGNVRELVNAVENSVSMAEDDPILFPIHLPVHIRSYLARAALKSKSATPVIPNYEVSTDNHFPGLRALLDQTEKKYLKDLLIFCQGNMKDACRISELPRSSLYERLRKYHIEIP